MCQSVAQSNMKWHALMNEQAIAPQTSFAARCLPWRVSPPAAQILHRDSPGEHREQQIVHSSGDSYVVQEEEEKRNIT